MPRKRRITDGSRLFESDVCAFCGTDEENELLYGKFIVTDDLTLHNNCMFFASALCQTKEDETDILSGFLPADIEEELRRGKKLFCTYCRKRGATIGCCEAKCKKSFHLPCGIKNGSLHQFFGSFSSYCKVHAPRQKPIDVSGGLICNICCEDITKDELHDYLYSPCCKNSWFHKICLQKYAQSAGLYFFKCPLCNNSKEFVQEMKEHGICIPDKDASWELEENAFQDLLIKPECDAPSCSCPKGRKYCPKKKSGWTLSSCSYCGSHARHINCREDKSSSHSWICSECQILENEIIRRRLSSEVVVIDKLLEVKLSPIDYDDNKTLTSPIVCLPSSSSLSSSSCAVSIHDDQKASPVKRNITYDFDQKVSPVKGSVSNDVDSKASPAKENISFDVDPKASPVKGNISYDVDPKASPAKGNISYDVDQKASPAKKNISFDVDQKASPVKENISFGVDQKASPAKRNIFCCIDPLHFMMPSSTDMYSVVNGYSSDDSEPDATQESLLKMKLSSSAIELGPDPYIRDISILKVMGLKDIKNLSSNSVPASRTKNTVKDVDDKQKVVIKRKAANKQKVDKKHKVDDSCCSSNHLCLRKYFGQFRL